MAGAGAQKDIEQIVRAVKKNGYQVVPARGGHRKVMLRGKPVVDKDGPIIFSGSTGEARGRTMSINRLMKAGVLTEDPFSSHTDVKAARENGNGAKPKNPNHKGNPHLGEPWMREKAQAAMREKSEQNRIATIALREKFEPIMVKLGGWDKKGNLAQIAEAADWLLRTRGWVGMEKVSSSNWCYHVLQKMRKGETLAQESRERFDEFIKDLEAHPDSVVRFFEIVRLSKGLAGRDPDAPPADGAAVRFPVRAGTPLPLPGQNGEHPETPAERAIAARHEPVEHLPYTMPTLALEAVWRMGKAKGADYDDVMEVGERILKLELESRGG